MNSGRSKALRPFIDNYIDYISKRQFRLPDGTLARNRPQPNTLWLDDLYMSVPALAQMGKLTGNNDYFEDACKQVIQFSQRMFNKERESICMDGSRIWNPILNFTGHAAMDGPLLAMTELLDAMPQGYPLKKDILEQYRLHVKGLVSFQSGTGFWHQLLDRNDSYLETSATAIFTYCIAHGINMGWLDATGLLDLLLFLDGMQYRPR